MRKRFICAIAMLALGILIYYISKKYFQVSGGEILKFIRNYIPDSLWSISFYLVSSSILKQISKNYNWLALLYCAVFSILFEVLQKFNIVKGTFDIFDIVTYMISLLFICFLDEKKEEGK